MKRFLVTVFIGVLIPVIALIPLNAAYMQTNYYTHLNGLGKFHDVPKQIEIANFGNSHSVCAFNWTVTNYNGANMALYSQGLIYDRAIFEQYFDNFKEDATIVIGISFISLYENEDTKEGGAQRYYQFLDKQFIKNWNIVSDFQYRVCPLVGAKAKGLQVLFCDDTSEAEMTIRGEIQHDKGSPSLGREEIGYTRAQGFLREIGNQELGDEYEALLQMLDKCKEKNMQVILVTLPTMEYLYKNFSDEFFDKFYQDIEGVCKMYDFVEYKDYTGDPRFKDKEELFLDTDHLNEEGGKYFTKIFCEDMKILEYK